MPVEAERTAAEPVLLAGARFEFPAAAELLDRAAPGDPPVLVPAPGEPTPRFTLRLARVSHQGRDVLRLRAEVTGVPADGRVHPAVVGLDYANRFADTLTRLITPWAADRIPDRERPAPPAAEDRSGAGLTASVQRGRPGLSGLVTDVVEAEGAAGTGSLRAFLELMVRVAREQAGGPPGDFLAGRRFVLARTAAAANSGEASEPALTLDDLGGLPDVVAQLRDVADSFRHPEVMARWGARRPQGILLTGPPGTGKTTLAKALAAEIGAELREIRTPDILDQWVGSSERNIRRIFAEARAARSATLLLFDEFDSIIGYVGAPRGGADQVMNSVAGLFKQELNTLVEANPNVIVVATTNFPERVDDSLVRSGRFDVKLHVPLPDAGARADILAKLLRRLSARHDRAGFRLFGPDVDVPALADATPGLSGADLTEVLRRVRMTKAMQEARGGAPASISQHDLLLAVAQLSRPRR